MINYEVKYKVNEGGFCSSECEFELSGYPRTGDPKLIGSNPCQECPSLISNNKETNTLICEKYNEKQINNFIKLFKIIQVETHENAKRKGWWEKDIGDAVTIANVHGELSEAWEWIRKDNPKSDHIPVFSGVEEEFADVIIRIMDTSEKRGYRLAEAILEKMKFNETREHRHGGKLY